MTLGDIDGFLRNILLNEPDPTERFPYSMTYDAINEGQRAVAMDMMDLEFPATTISTTTVANQQEYALPELIAVCRVYVAGQPIVKTDIGTLEGYGIEMYDQTAGIPPFQPQWKAQTAQAYPVSAPSGYPVPAGLPWQTGMRPEWYDRGGYLGLVPPPANAVTLALDIVPMPDLLVNPSDISIFPSNAREAIARRAQAYLLESDDDPQGGNDALSKYEKALAALRMWRSNITGTMPNRIKVIPYRTMYQGPLPWDSGAGY